MIDGHIHFHKQPYTLETIDLMVEEALKNGVTTLYLLDHTHKFYEFLFLYDNLSGDETLGWFKKKIHMPIKEYLDFIELVKSKEYPVEIKFGLEVCYMYEFEDRLKEELAKYNFDFLIGSVHQINGIGYDLCVEIWDGQDTDLFYKEYYYKTKRLIESDLFDILGHPDCITAYEIYPSFPLRPYLEEIAKLLKKHNMKTENNTKRGGLKHEFLEILKEYNIPIHLSSDAHRYYEVGRDFKDYIDITFNN